MKKLLMFFPLLLLLSNCEDKPEPVAGKDRVLFGNHLWRISAIKSDWPVSINGVHTTDWYANLDECHKDDFYKAAGETRDAILLGIYDQEKVCGYEQELPYLTFARVTDSIYDVNMCCGMEKRVYGIESDLETGFMENWKVISASEKKLVFEVNKRYEEENYKVEITFEVL